MRGERGREGKIEREGRERSLRHRSRDQLGLLIIGH